MRIAGSGLHQDQRLGEICLVPASHNGLVEAPLNFTSPLGLDHRFNLRKQLWLAPERHPARF
jgi:hypothetical protein